MSTLQQDTYTSSEEDEYVFEEQEQRPVEKVAKKQSVEKVVEKQPVEKVEEVEEEVMNGFEFDNEQDSSGSEYEEIIVRKKKVKKKSGKKSRPVVLKTDTVSLTDENVGNVGNVEDTEQLTNFINEFEGVDPYNFQLVLPGQ